MRSIGEMARVSGLSVSALRFYDGAGVLVPAAVDPGSGYRWYADEQIRAARLVAGLRRVGMPLADITRVLDAVADPVAARRLLDAHLRRLEDGLADARRELSRVHALLDHEETNMTRVTLSAADLTAAVDAVRFAVSADPEIPVLGGVLLEVASDGLRLVATDRYRMAVAATPVADIDGPPVTVVAPRALIDEVRAQQAPAERVTVTVTRDLITVAGFGADITGVPLDLDFPDYRRALADAGADRTGPRVTVGAAALRAGLADAPVVTREHLGVSHDLAVLTVDPAGELRFAGADAWSQDESGHVAVNRGFLLEAVDAAGGEQLVLELDGPIRPLAVRVDGARDTYSILMPVRV